MVQHQKASKVVMKNNAICLSLSNLFAQVDAAFHAPPSGGPHILHNATAFAWKVDPEQAQDVEYAFGIAEGRVVSAYRVGVPAAEWPVMPDGCPPETRGRRVIPLTQVSRPEWTAATSWPGVPMYGALRYAHLEVAPDGSWRRLVAPESEPSPGERAEDDSTSRP